MTLELARCPTCGWVHSGPVNWPHVGPDEAPPCEITGNPPRCLTHDVLATSWETADDGPTAAATTPVCPLAGLSVPEPPEWRCTDCGTTGTLTESVTHPDHCEGPVCPPRPPDVGDAVWTASDWPVSSCCVYVGTDRCPHERHGAR